MNDIRVLFRTVTICVFHTEFFGDHRVDLDGDEGIFLTENVLDLDIELGAVERRLADTDLIVDAKVVEDLAHHTLDVVPLLLGTDVLFTVVGIPLGEAIGNVLIQTQGL